MISLECAVNDFCARHGLKPGPDDFRAGVDLFVSEMEAGLEGVGSLKMLPTYIDPSVLPDFTRKTVVIDAGGTNLRVVLVSFSDDFRPVFEYYENHPMLGTNGEITSEEFFDGLAEYLEPVVGKADNIGFCFSFPTLTLPDRDAKVMHLSKEVRISGIEGRLLGQGLRDALKARGLSCGSVTVLNDAVAALLGGIIGADRREFGGFSSIILGSGTNSSYIEECKNITKDPLLAAKGGYTAVNLESSAYARAPRDCVDIAFDAKTDMPGFQPFEKMTAGAYSGPLFLEFIKAAAGEGCFDAETVGRIEALNSLSAMQIDEFCDYPYGRNTLAALAGNSENARRGIYILADAFCERASALVATNLTAIIKKSGAGKNPCRPVCISAEGTSFYKAKLFRAKLDYYMEAFVRRELGLHYTFTRISDCVILGTAAAGLLGS